MSRSDEIAYGKQARQEVLTSIGSYSDPELSKYVAELGQRIGKATERPDLPWSFDVLDDPAVNAFALPGGPIFVTRGILTHLNSEAELASVLGHECGHVAAKHSVAMMSRAQLAELGLGLGSIFVPQMATIGGLIGAGIEILFLRYGRDAERQSDTLAVRYGLALGYDMRAMKDLFIMLAAASNDPRGRLPEWLSTHPSPEKRLERIDEQLASLPDVDFNRLVRGRERYLRQLEGVVYGEDYEQGYVTGNAFIHPTLGFRVDFPDGWRVQNLRAEVSAVSPEGDAAVQFALSASSTPDAALQRFLSRGDVEVLSASSADTAALPPTTRYFRARAENGQVAGIVSFFRFGERTYRYAGLTVAARLNDYDRVFRSTLGGVTHVTDPKLLAVKPARIKLATVPGDLTLAQLNERNPSAISLRELAVINGVPPDRPLPPGLLIKRVVDGNGSEK